MTSFTKELIKDQQRQPAEQWFKRIAGSAAIEMSIVGDIQVDDAIKLVGTYLGSLPKRTGTFADLDSLRHFQRGPGPYSETVTYRAVEPKALVLAGFVGCDLSDPIRRPLALASLILTERMIQRARFEEQLVYSISCSSIPGRSVPGTGLISAASSTDPRNANKLADDITEIIRDFATDGPTEDELAAAKKQMANQIDSQMKQPAFWLSQTADLEYRKRSLNELKNLQPSYQSFTATQLRDAVSKFATPDHLVRLVVLPDATEANASTEPATQPSIK